MARNQRLERAKRIPPAAGDRVVPDVREEEHVADQQDGEGCEEEQGGECGEGEGRGPEQRQFDDGRGMPRRSKDEGGKQNGGRRQGGAAARRKRAGARTPQARAAPSTGRSVSEPIATISNTLPRMSGKRPCSGS